MLIETTLSKGYQITLPSAMRKALKLEAGDELVLEQRKEGILLKKALTREEQINKAFKELDAIRREQEKQMTSKQRAFAKRSAGWTISQYHEYIDNLPETKEYIKEKYDI